LYKLLDWRIVEGGIWVRVVFDWTCSWTDHWWRIHGYLFKERT
jgi:hypothetical protein